ncbi:beta-xylosidase, partial [Mycobacterium interjectum]|nr:beta-xylosidase [Mycobacterium interjectum]
VVPVGDPLIALAGGPLDAAAPVAAPIIDMAGTGKGEPTGPAPAGGPVSGQPIAPGPAH